MHDDFIDPRAPLLEEINVARILSRDNAQAYFAKGIQSPCLAVLFRLYSENLVDEATGALSRKTPVFADFLNLLEQLSTVPPTSAVLHEAPLLERWCAGLIDPTPRLFGRVTGHPRLREGARIFTSPYLLVSPEGGWARTWRRFYRLGHYDRYFFGELMVDGVIPTQSELIEL